MSETDIQSCPECGTEVVPGKVYCRKCGANVSRASDGNDSPEVTPVAVEVAETEEVQTAIATSNASPVTLVLACILTIGASYGVFQVGKSVLLYEYPETRARFDTTETARIDLEETKAKRDAIVTAVFGGDEKFNALLESKSITPFSITEYANLGALRDQFGPTVQAPAVESEDLGPEDSDDGPPEGFGQNMEENAGASGPVQKSDKLVAVIQMDQLPEEVDRAALGQITVDEAIDVASAKSMAYEAESVHFNMISIEPRYIQSDANLQSSRRQANIDGSFRMFGGNWIHHTCWLMVSCVAGILAGTITWSLGGSSAKQSD